MDSDKEMVREIVKDLLRIRNELEDRNENIRDQMKHEDGEIAVQSSPPRKRRNVGPLASTYGSIATEFLLAVYDDKEGFDTSFGIHMDIDRNMKIGDKRVYVDRDDIIVNNEVYTGTPGLWSVVTRTRPFPR